MTVPNPISMRGNVYYSDGKTPVVGATIKVWDEDFGANDTIVNAVTSASGRYSGSGRWQDEFGELLPDFRFRVRLGNRVYSGPYFHLDHMHARVVTPWPVPCAAPKAKRGVLVFITLSKNTFDLTKPVDAALSALYKAIEAGAELSPNVEIKNYYGAFKVVKNPNATLANLCAELGHLTSTCDAIDLIFVTHGADQTVVFDGPGGGATAAHAIADVRAAIEAAIPASRRKRLRMVFSTACFGKTHLSAWIGAGFKVASGSRGIYADSAVSYGDFLRAWRDGRSFKSAIDVTNAKTAERALWDGIAKAGYPGKVVDSWRDIAGDGKVTICTKPG